MSSYKYFSYSSTEGGLEAHSENLFNSGLFPAAGPSQMQYAHQLPENWYPTATVPTHVLPIQHNGYTATVVPPIVATHYQNDMAILTSQQTQPYYGSQGVDPHGYNSWGHQQYGTVDGHTLPVSINTTINIGHDAPPAQQGNAEVYMILSRYGLMETTKSPNSPTHPCAAYMPLPAASMTPTFVRGVQLQIPARPQHPAHTLSDTSTAAFVLHSAPSYQSVHTPLPGPSTGPFVQHYPEESRSVVRVSSSVDGPRQSPPSIPAPTLTKKEKPTSVEGPLRVCPWSERKKKPKPKPEAHRDRRETGAQWVAWEYNEVTDEVKKKGKARVSLRKKLYITSWEMYDTVRVNFLWCEEEGCKRKKHLANRQTLLMHLQTHARDKMVRRRGETDKSYEARWQAAGHAKLREQRYLEKIENFRSLSDLVKGAAERGKAL